MKLVGYTPDHGTILELTREEAAEFQKLISSVRGQCNHWGFKEEFPRDGAIGDYAGVFGAIRAFYVSRFQVNHLRRHVEDMEEFLGRTVKPEDGAA